MMPHCPSPPLEVPFGFVLKKLGWKVIFPRETSAESGRLVREGKDETTWDVETGTSFGVRHANGEGTAVGVVMGVSPVEDFDPSPGVSTDRAEESEGPRGEPDGLALSHDSISDKI